MVGGEGIEPTRAVRHEIYSLAPLLTGLPAHILAKTKLFAFFIYNFNYVSNSFFFVLLL